MCVTTGARRVHCTTCQSSATVSCSIESSGSLGVWETSVPSVSSVFLFHQRSHWPQKNKIQEYEGSLCTVSICWVSKSKPLPPCTPVNSGRLYAHLKTPNVLSISFPWSVPLVLGFLVCALIYKLLLPLCMDGLAQPWMEGSAYSTLLIIAYISQHCDPLYQLMCIDCISTDW